MAKTRGIRGYKHMFKERLLSSLSEKGLDNARIIKIREDSKKSPTAHGKLKVYSGNQVIDYETPGERKIQLKMKN